MKKLYLLYLVILFSLRIFAQKSPATNEYSTIDKKALAMPDSLGKTTENIANYINTNFKTDKEKTRAIFIWLATNIEYDIENMYALNFYEKKAEKISKSLKTKKGICENYAALFHDICSKSGIKSFVIEGYTKQNGFTDYIPHAWCAARVDTSWFMFDPTWGSGYINGGKFYKKVNNDYYKVSPAKIIKSHMPFDYLWQFLNYPITNQEFYDGKIQENKTKPFFSFLDSIKIFETQNHIEQLTSTSYRVEKNGLKNAMIFDRLQHIKLEIENDKQAKTVGLYNSAADEYNRGINDYNDFINYKNKQFIPKKTDPEIQAMLDTSENKLKGAKTKLEQISNPDANALNMIKQLNKSINDASALVKEQQDWLKLYFSKSPNKRKSMFFQQKTTVFGIPVN